MPVMPTARMTPKTSVFNFSPTDSFALYVALEVIRSKKWLKAPDKNLYRIDKVVWEYRNKKIEYLFQFHSYSQVDRKFREFSVKLDLTELTDGIDGVYEALSVSPRDKLKGDCSAVVEKNGNITGISLITDKNSIFD